MLMVLAATATHSRIAPDPDVAVILFQRQRADRRVGIFVWEVHAKVTE